MTEYNSTQRCEEHKKRQAVPGCIWCQIDALKEEIIGLKLEVAHLKGEKGCPSLRTSLWSPAAGDRR